MAHNLHDGSAQGGLFHHGVKAIGTVKYRRYATIHYKIGFVLKDFAQL